MPSTPTPAIVCPRCCLCVRTDSKPRRVLVDCTCGDEQDPDERG